MSLAEIQMVEAGLETARKPSALQKEAARYYSKLGISYDTAMARKRAEIQDKRYSDVNVPCFYNFASVTTAMAKLVKKKEGVNAIHIGCKPNWFVNYASWHWGWNILGYGERPESVHFARELWSDSRLNYRIGNVLDGLPLEDESQDCVLCNAVIQHFDDDELMLFFQEASRIIRPGGILALVFKRQVKSASFTRYTGLEIQVVDELEGLFRVEDREMAAIIRRMVPEDRDRFAKDEQRGMRLFRFFKPARITRDARHYNFGPAPRLPGRSRKHPSMITYKSGKGIPTACGYFVKN